MKVTIVCALAGAVLLAVPATAGAAATATPTPTIVKFERGAAPCGFAETKPLRDQYADKGVRFRGPNQTTGGAVLNDCSLFGVHPRSGVQFLAFNPAGGYPITPERMVFATRQQWVSLYVAAGAGAPATIRLRALRDGTEVARSVVRVTTADWVPLSVASTGGIDTVMVNVTSSEGWLVVDDLTFEPLG